jgi:hypothetical protein
MIICRNPISGWINGRCSGEKPGIIKAYPQAYLSVGDTTSAVCYPESETITNSKRTV